LTRKLNHYTITINNGRVLQKVDANYNGSKATRIPIPKVHINGKINIRMRKNIKNQC
jgi:predicted ribonuclease toxin of YeeF-YezG toxin-antitoxin module